MKRTMESIRAKMACSLNRQKYGNLGNCDVCEDQNPRCYCAADEAYLCDYCDESVDGVNSLALNHERVTLDRDESVHMVPHNIVRRAAPNESIYPSQTKHGSFNGFNFHCRNFRSFQYKKHLPIVDAKEVIAVQNSSKVGGITYTRGTKVKQEPAGSRLQEELNMRELSSAYHKCTEPSQYCSSFHEVPVLVRVAQEMPASTILADACRQPTLAAHSEDSSECNSMGFIVPDHCNVDDYLVSNTDLISKEEEAASVVSSPKLAFKAEEKTWWESDKNQSILESSLVTEESQQIISYNYEKYFTDDLQLKYLDLNVLKHSGMPEAEYCRQTFVPLLRVCEKLKVERAEETEQINQLLEATIGRPLHITSKETRNQKSFNLRLNFEDVLSAWSDRGCFTTDCQWPRTRPPNLTSGSTDEVSLDVGIVPVIEPKTVKYLEQKEEAQAFATSEKNGGREARVLRYREKRQTRLFSKTIRYEVRKMNADRRPRIKGRFVKRHVDVLKP